MVRSLLTKSLSSYFNLPVLESRGQIAVEKAIGFDLIGELIKVKIKEGECAEFEFDLDIWFRCPSGFDGIGYLTAKLSLRASEYDVNGVQLTSYENAEVVELINSTEMIISKRAKAFISVEFNKVRELIKSVELEVN